MPVLMRGVIDMSTCAAGASLKITRPDPAQACPCTCLASMRDVAERLAHGWHLATVLHALARGIDLRRVCQTGTRRLERCDAAKAMQHACLMSSHINCLHASQQSHKSPGTYMPEFLL